MRILLLALCLALGAWAQPNTELKTLYRELTEFGLQVSPESATRAGRNDYNDRWSDYSPAAWQAARPRWASFLQRLKSVDASKLNESERVHLETTILVIERSMEREEKLGAYGMVSHYTGPQGGIVSTLQLSPARNVKDYENLIARIKGTPKLVEGLIAQVEAARAQKLVQPKVVVERVLKQLDTQAAAPAAQSPMLEAFRKFPAAVPAGEQARLQKEAYDAYTNVFQPAWKRYRSFIADSFLPNARQSFGMYDVPNGKPLYRLLVSLMTTTDLAPAQIHEMGVQEAARIEAEMAAIRKELGFNGTPAEFAEKVLNAPEFRFKSEQEILAHGREIAKRIDPELPRLFRKLPRMPYGVKAIPPDRASSAAPYYQGPALDGSRAGNFFLRTVNPQEQSKCCMEALILHEAVPGHHLQIALANENEEAPEFLRIFGGFAAYSEGWGLYAESLGSELGMYQSPYERYGRLQSEHMRALRLIVDTGLHELGWTRDKAIETLSRCKGGWINDEFIRNEVDRYIAMPGQALAYKVGELKIKELRARSEQRLGARFDIREFHDVVLRNGGVPLTILERVVNRWLEEKSRQ